MKLTTFNLLTVFIVIITLIGIVSNCGSSLKTVYNDVKESISGLATALKVGSEYVYAVLIKQQIVKSIVNSFLFIMSIISLTLAYKQWGKIKFIEHNRYERDIEEIRPVIFTSIFILIGISLFIYSLINLNSTITGIINPEYGAIKDILEFIKK